MNHLRCALLCAVLSSGTAWADVLDLATLPTEPGVLLRLHGSTGTGAAGVPVAGALDVDGDQKPDVALASLLASPGGRTDAGEVYLLFGDGVVGGSYDTAVADPRILVFQGSAIAETTGSEIWMDDVTDDGLADLLIARQNFDPGGRPGAGALSIVVGGSALRAHAATLAPFDLAAPPPGVLVTTLVGAAAVDRLGIWMRTGDVTGDGVADLVVAADQEDGQEAGREDDHRGAVYVVRGGPHLAARQTIDLAAFGSTALAGHLARIVPPAGAHEFHLGATCQIADLDGNGRGEVLAAATLSRAGAGIRPLRNPPGRPTHSSGGTPDGTLFIVWDDHFPTGAWPAGYEIDLEDPPGTVTVIDGGAGNQAFGEELLGGLDYDGDGRAELFVGDLISDQAGPFRAGVGHVFFDAAALAGLTFDLDAAPPGVTVTTILGGGVAHIAADTAAHGDFDADGLADLAVASPHASPLGRADAGAVHVLHGRRGGWPATIDLAPGALPPPEQIAITEIAGARGRDGLNRGDVLAYSAAAGDLDRDGRIDLIVNEMLGDAVPPGPVDVGNLIVVSGRQIAEGPSLPEACADGIDNDADTLIDFPEDPGCTDRTDDSERSPTIECDDGIDNDEDGQTDFPRDASCLGATDPTEDADPDGDDVSAYRDSCLEVPNPDQTDTDRDGYGNRCDADYDNDGAVGIADFNVLRPQYGLTDANPLFDPAVDMNDDGAIGLREFDLLRGSFGAEPGPSGLGCAGTAPCP
ncbi:MAG: hypothetical protein QNK03_24395 [Myxococcota bacterium]|nr:hypothetical protein [Myxococcota bacterium]